MSNDYQYPHDLPMDNSHNDPFFSSNDLNAGFGVSDPTGGFDQSWDPQPPDFFAQPQHAQSDTFGWPSHQQSHQYTQHPQTSAVFNDPPLSTNSHQQQLQQSPANQARFNFNEGNAIDPAFIRPNTTTSLPPQTYPPSGHQSSNTITPEALQTRPSPATALQNNAQAAQQLQSLASKLPAGVAQGAFVVITPESLQQNMNCRGINKFLSAGLEPLQLPLSASNIPTYNPRKSRSQIELLLRSNKSLSTVTIKRPSKKASKPNQPVSRTARLLASGKVAGPLGKREDSISESGSSSGYTDSESDDEVELAPIPAERPTELKAGTRYDAIKVLWLPRNRTVPADSIREALKLFWEDLKAIRERWKSDQDNVEAAEERKARDLPVLKERAESQRQLLEIALKAAVQHGHPDILAHFGRSKAVLQILNVFLRDRSKATDYNGSLSLAILDFIAHSGTIDTVLFKDLSLDKVLGRFGARGDGSVKALVKQINSNTATGSAKKVNPVAAKAPVEANKLTNAPNGLAKRSVPSPDSNSASPAKKAAISSLAREQQDAVKKTVSGATAAKSATAPAASASAKPKTNHIYAKPSGFFSSLQSAKKPTSQNATKPTDVSKTAPPAAASVVSNKPAAKPNTKAAGPSSSYSFSSMLASVNVAEAPKKVEKKVNEPEPPAVEETAEQKAKRLRKEQRRRLRVSWAPEDSLVQIKVFEHDPDEELGHDAAQTRDVGNLKSESIMFKHLSGTSLDIEEDEDGDSAGGDPLIRQWREPQQVDFSGVLDQTKDQTYEPYVGGRLKVDSSEAIANENREASVLLVVYTDDSDIPPSPKEPVEEAEEAEKKVVDIGRPAEHIQKRMAGIKEARERNQSLSAELTSLLGSIPPPIQPAVSGLPTQSDLASLLGSLPGQQPQHSTFVPQPAVPQAQNGPQDISAILAALNQPSQAPAQPFIPASQQAAPTPDLTSLLATLSANQQQAAPPPLPPQMTGFNPFAAAQPWMQQAGQQWGNAPAPTGNGMYENPDRKRFRDEGDAGDSGRSKRPFALPYKVQPCKYYLEGKCNKGDSCTYKHDE